MKNDCDEAGLEYELLLQGPQGPRYLRDLNEYYTHGDEKPDHIILLKHKRQSNETATEEPLLGISLERKTSTKEQGDTTESPTTTTTKLPLVGGIPILGNSLPASVNPALPNFQKIMLVLRERMAARRPN